MHTATESQQRLSQHETPLLWRLLGVLGAVLLLAFLVAAYFGRPCEDALILYQYSANLARTGVISFIPGGPPAEGASDFLWMVYLAAGRWLGIPSYGLSIATSALCAIALAAVLLRLAHQQLNPRNVLALTGLTLLAPQVFAAETGFSVLPFALLLVLTAALAITGRYGAASIAALALCLTRPDGIVFALPLLALYLVPRNRIDPRHAIATRALMLAIGFVLPGLLYFLWRWHYFGHLFPLPFYVKSDTPRLLGILVPGSAIGLASPLAAACAMLAIALRRDALRARNLLLFAAMVLPSSLFYLSMRLDQNYANRFFFYPLIAMAVLLAANYPAFRQRSRQVLIAGLVVWLVVLAHYWVNWAVTYAHQFTQPRAVTVSFALRDLPRRGTMLVTESGAIPYYSQWQAYDPWGLNTAAFATRLIQPADVAQLHPDLVILNPGTGLAPCTVTPGEALPHTTRTWNNMVQNVVAGIDPTQYSQWLLPEYNDSYRTHPWHRGAEHPTQQFDSLCWFVRTSYPHSAAVIDILKHSGAVPAK